MFALGKILNGINYPAKLVDGVAFCGGPTTPLLSVDHWQLAPLGSKLVVASNLGDEILLGHLWLCSLINRLTVKFVRIVVPDMNFIIIKVLIFGVFCHLPPFYLISKTLSVP